MVREHQPILKSQGDKPCQMEESLREAIWQLSEDPYTEFISWPLDRFSFFPPIDGGSDLWWKMPLIFLALPCVKLGEYF